MLLFIGVFLYIAITIELCPFFWSIVELELIYNSFYFYFYFLFFFYINFFFTKTGVYFNNNFDLLIKFFRFIFVSFSKFYFFLILELKKFILYFFSFKFKVLINTWKLFFISKISNLFIFWRPLFKRWSYFGYYRSNRSKWIK